MFNNIFDNLDFIKSYKFTLYISQSIAAMIATKMRHFSF